MMNEWVPDVDLGHAKRAVAQIEAKGFLGPEEAMHLAEAGIPIYSYVSVEGVREGSVCEVPAEVREIIASAEGLQ